MQVFWITRCQEIVCIGEYYAGCSNHVWFSSKITTKVLHVCAKFNIKICKYVVFVAKNIYLKKKKKR